MKITVLMPALNEEKSIRETISRIPVDELKSQGFELVVLLVDGGSSDKTVEIAESLGIRVIKCLRGYGRQYKKGFENVQGEIIVTADSDCSYPMEDIPNLLDMLIKENLDFISTNRFAFMEEGSMKPINRIGNKILTLIANFLFNLKLNDSQSGMWIIRRNILKGMKLTSNGMPFSQEIKIEAFKKFKSKEVDSSYKKRIGKVKLRKFIDGLDNIFNLFKRRIQG